MVRLAIVFDVETMCRAQKNAYCMPTTLLYASNFYGKKIINFNSYKTVLLFCGNSEYKFLFSENESDCSTSSVEK